MDYYNNQDNEGEMMFAFYNVGTEAVVIEAGDKLGQGIFVKYGVTDDDKAEGERKGRFWINGGIIYGLDDTICNMYNIECNSLL